MYGNPGKLGRGGGGGGGAGGGGRGVKRIHHTPLPPPHRPGGGARPPVGGAASRHRHGASNTGSSAAAPPATEETFSLATSDPLAFAAIVRLTPDIVEEIRRVEAQGGTARIKFDPNANKSSGNVIDVGGKDFKFTWAQELGDLCDIYEERQSGEDGNGLLVESGSAWRKLNVHRILDESTKNHVKMRSEEAERLLKSRKAIVLDQGNPSVKNQVKPLVAAAVDVNARRMPFKQKKEPPVKKRKVEPSQGPPKSVFKSGISPTTTSRGRLSLSPLSSPPEQPANSASPFGIGNLSRVHASVDEAILPQMTSKEDAVSSEKEIHSRVFHADAREVSGHKGVVGPMEMGLRSILINLLLENPKGMSLKALEKAIGDTIPNSGKKLETIIKKIATYQAPGRYILKPGVEIESFKKPSFESGSSPECVRDQTPTLEPAFEQKAQLAPTLEESNILEKIDVRNSPEVFASDRKVSNNSEGRRVGSSSESGSDSESESDSSDSGSDSGSQSRSRSKSRSPVGSGSVSSSDSDSDGSSSSKEGSDVDVDIMTSDDDKEEAEHKLQALNSKLSIPPATSNLKDAERCDGLADPVEITKEIHIDDNIGTYESHETEMGETTELVPYKTKSRSLEEGMPFSPHHHKQPERQQISNIGNFVNDTSDPPVEKSFKERPTMVKDNSGREQSDSTERISRGKYKRDSKDKSESNKRLKAGSLVQQQSFGKRIGKIFAGNPHLLSSDKPDQDMNKDHTKQNIESPKGYGLAMPGKFMTYENVHRNNTGADIQNSSMPDAQRSGQRTSDFSLKGKALDNAERPGKYIENLGRCTKHSERVSVFSDESDGSGLRGNHLQDKFSVPKDKLYKEAQDEYGDGSEKYLTKNVKESVVGDEPLTVSDSYRKTGEQSGKLKVVDQMAHLQTGNLPKDNGKPDVEKSALVNGKGSILRRELSDLELGELREPVPGDDTQVVKKKFEKKNSFKLYENKLNAVDHLNSDISKGRPTAKAIQEPKRLSPSSIKVATHGNQDELYRKRMLEDDLDDSTRPRHRALPSQAQQILRVDHADPEAGSQLDKLADMAIKARKNEGRASHGIGLEGHAGSHLKTPLSILPQQDNKSGGQTLISSAGKEAKPQKSTTARDSVDRRKDGFWMESSINGGKRRESSSDEDTSLYSKYEKDEPELKGPIKDNLQYEEYRQEYCEKYDCYSSLNKKLDNFRSDFQKLGHDFVLAKGRDSEEYQYISKQLKEAYSQCGMRHKWMKKIFVVLHEELKHLKQRMKDYALTYTRD